MPPPYTQAREATTAVAALGESKPEIGQRSTATYRPDIDGLRAVAIVAVILFHASPSLAPGGFVGVDVFFVVSGFLISNILLRALQDGTFSFAAFYANRIRRLFPALLVVLAACFIAGWFLLLPDEYERLGKHIFGAAAYVENLLLRREAGYFDVGSYSKPLMHLWSLGIEEQFYLSYPLFLWAMWRFRRNLFAILVAIVLASFVLNLVQVGHDPVGTFFLPQTRCWELAVGCAISCWQLFGKEHSPPHWMLLVRAAEWRRVHERWFVNICSGLGIALIGLAVFRIRANDAFPGWWALLPVCGASLVMVGGPHAWMNRTILANPQMVFVGLISYPLYLWHWPLLAFVRMVHGGEVPATVRMAAVLLSFFLAWATFRFVERPIRFGNRSWIRVASLAAISVVLAGAGYAAKRDGFVGRFPNAVEDLGRLREVVWSTPQCRSVAKIGEIDDCRATSANAPDVLLIGDSHAAVLYDGLAPLYQKRGLTLMNLGESGCAPFYDTHTFSPGRRGNDCKRPVNAMLDFAVHSATARTVILSFRGTRYMSGTGFSAGEPGPAPKIWWEGVARSTAQPETYVGALRHTISVLHASGKSLLIFLDWPELGFDPRSCLARPISFSTAARKFCGVPRSEVEARNQANRKLLFQLQKEFEGVKVFDPVPYLCDSTACYAMKDGHLLYSDDNHVSLAGANYLAGKYFGQTQ